MSVFVCGLWHCASVLCSCDSIICVLERVTSIACLRACDCVSPYLCHCVSMFALRLCVRVFACLCAHKCVSLCVSATARAHPNISGVVRLCVRVLFARLCVRVPIPLVWVCVRIVRLCVRVCFVRLCVCVRFVRLCLRVCLHTRDHLTQNLFPCPCVRVLACCHARMCVCVFVCCVYLFNPFPSLCFSISQIPFNFYLFLPLFRGKIPDFGDSPVHRRTPCVC